MGRHSWVTISRVTAGIIAVAVAVLAGQGEGTLLAIGQNVSVHTPTMYHPKLVRLSGDTALLCFTCGTSTNFATCKVLVNTGAAVANADEFIVNPAPSYYLALTKVGTDSAILCYRDSSNGNSAGCNVLRLSGTTVSIGSKLTFPDVGPISHLALAELKNDRVLFCYPEIRQHDLGKCRVLNVTGLSLTPNDAITPTDGPMRHPALVQVNENKVILCYTDNSILNRGHCTVIISSVTELTKEGDLIIDSRPMYYPLMVKFDTDMAMLCYTDLLMSNFLTCNMLSAPDNQPLTKGDTLSVDGGFTFYPALSKLDSNMMMLCRSDVWPLEKGTCNVITVSGNKLQLADTLTVKGGSIYQPVLAQLDTNRAVLCYAREKGFCNVILDTHFV